MYHHKIILTSTALILGLLGSAQAAVIATETGSSSAFTVSSTDLAQTNLDNLNYYSLNYYGAAGFGSANPEALHDGSMVAGENGYVQISGAALPQNSNNTIDFNFDLTASAGGYEINQIDTFSGNGNASRVKQSYTVSYATVAAPTTFTDFATIVGAVATSESKFSITENVTGILATDVATIRFVFEANQANGGTNYKEFDIIGTAIPEPGTSVYRSIPEPGTYALIAGMLGLSYVMVRRRR
jgi:hypothetical protein